MAYKDQENSRIDNWDSLDREADTDRYIEEREEETCELQYILQDIIESDTANWDEQHPANKKQENYKVLHIKKSNQI